MIGKLFLNKNIGQYYYLKILNKVFNGWYNYALNKKFESQLSLPEKSTIQSWSDEGENHFKVSEDY